MDYNYNDSMELLRAFNIGLDDHDRSNNVISSSNITYNPIVYYSDNLINDNSLDTFDALIRNFSSYNASMDMLKACDIGVNDLERNNIVIKCNREHSLDLEKNQIIIKLNIEHSSDLECSLDKSLPQTNVVKIDESKIIIKRKPSIIKRVKSFFIKKD